ncbi:MAG: hypothetical protein AAB358_01905 [Patescibacteria group bacterium]
MTEKEPTRSKENDFEERKQLIELCKKRNLEWIDEVIQQIPQARRDYPDPSIDWDEQEREWLKEKELISDLFNLGKESAVLIDPLYYLIPLKMASRLGIDRLRTIKELVEKFIPLEKLKGYLKEINFQSEESYLSAGCEGFFHDGIAEIPKYITFNGKNPDNFSATVIHETAGHPVGLLIEQLNPDAKTVLDNNYQILKNEGIFFSGSVGRVYPKSEMESSFDQFIAEFTKQYCLENDALCEFIENLPPKARDAYKTFYNFFKNDIYDGQEFEVDN